MEKKPMCMPDQTSLEPLTYAQYWDLPEDSRVELIDGVLYDLAPSDYRHNNLRDEILVRLMNHLEGKISHAIQGVTVRFEESKLTTTAVRPDISVVCDWKKIRWEGIVGAPDLIVEILSSSTFSRDMVTKLALYQAHGVREYWMAFRDRECVYQCELINGKYQMKPIMDGTIVSSSTEGFSMVISEVYAALCPLTDMSEAT